MVQLYVYMFISLTCCSHTGTTCANSTHVFKELYDYTCALVLLLQMIGLTCRWKGCTFSSTCQSNLPVNVTVFPGSQHSAAVSVRRWLHSSQNVPGLLLLPFGQKTLQSTCNYLKESVKRTAQVSRGMRIWTHAVTSVQTLSKNVFRSNLCFSKYVDVCMIQNEDQRIMLWSTPECKWILD